VSELPGRHDRDGSGRARNARARDDLGRPAGRNPGGAPPTDEPALPPDDALARAQQLLDSGRPFNAHEVLEAVWKETEPPESEVWRGLAQVAVGITHALRGNETGARSLLDRGAETLQAFAGTSPHRIDVDGVRDWALHAAVDVTMTQSPPRLAVR
jgi:hypothetical protein